MENSIKMSDFSTQFFYHYKKLLTLEDESVKKFMKLKQLLY